MGMFVNWKPSKQLINAATTPEGAKIMGHALKDFEGFRKRRDIFAVDPRTINIVPGYNPRQMQGTEQERKEKDERLKLSIIANGVLIPLSVCKNESGGLDLIDGERRLEQTLKAIAEGNAIETVPVQLERRNISDSEKLFLSLLRNDGLPLNAIEEARAFKRFVDYGIEVDEIARRIGRSKSVIYERLTLIDAGPDLQQAVIEKKVPLRKASKIVSDSKGSFDKQKKAVKKQTTETTYRPKKVKGKYDSKSQTIVFIVPGAENGDKPTKVRFNLDNVFNKDFRVKLAERGVDFDTIKFEAVYRPAV